MKVVLKEYPRMAEDLCGLAARVCVSEEPMEVGPGDLERSLESAVGSGHLSVLEHASFTFYIEGISRACSHQLVRHRMASYSQQSQRYVRMDDFRYVVPPTIESGYGEVEVYDEVGYVESVSLKAAYEEYMVYVRELYGKMVESGIPEEDARYILPNACKTNIMVTMNARELLHFFSLRLCSRAQWEIREMAEMMLEEVSRVTSIFDSAGPSCMRGPCPEGARSCGHPWRRVDG